MGDHEGAAEKLSILTNNVYDKFNTLVMVILPGLGALYFGLAQIWAFPEPEKVVGTITVVSVFLGLFLKNEKRKYDKSDAKYDGTMIVDHSIDGALGISGLNTNGVAVEDMLQQKEVLLKLQPDFGTSEVIPITEPDSQ